MWSAFSVWVDSVDEKVKGMSQGGVLSKENQDAVRKRQIGSNQKISKHKLMSPQGALLV